MWPFSPSKKAKKLLKKIATLEQENREIRDSMELWIEACRQARSDLKDVLAKTAIVHAQGSTFITKDAYARMSKGGVV